MIIEEKKIKGKVSPEKCEDGIVATDDFVAVIDGSTSKTPFSLKEGVRNGRLAMERIKRAISGLPRRSSLRQIVAELTDAIQREYTRYGLSQEHVEAHTEDRLTASVAIYSDYRRMVYLIGDCQAMVDGKLYENPKPYEAKLAAKRAKILKEAIENGASTESLLRNDIGRKAIVADLIEAMKEGQNKHYIVIDGTKPYMQGIVGMPVGSGNHDVILATDGYPVLRSTLMDSEGALLYQLYRDPLCIGQYQATKGKYPDQESFDDRAFIRFSV